MLQIIEVCYEKRCEKSTLVKPPVVVLYHRRLFDLKINEYGKLYVAEITAGRISKVDPATGNKVVFFVGVAGKPNAIGNDGSGNLIILDGASQKLFQLNTKNLALALIATDLPVGYSVVGSYPPIEFPWPMAVTAKGEVYIATMNRGIIKLRKK